MEEDLPVDPVDLLVFDDDGYGGDEFDVPESFGKGKKCGPGRPPKQNVKRCGGVKTASSVENRGSGSGRVRNG